MLEKWLKISMLLCTFGFFREMRPSEPFVTEYLAGEWRNITSEQVNKEIYPFGTYAVLAQLVIVFLVTDILRYKPIIILSALAGIVLFAILIWTKTIWELQIGQVFFGTFMASEVAYYTYIYAKVEKQHYQMVTGHTRAAILCGKFIGGVLAQILVSTNAMDFRELHFISFGSQIVSLAVAFLLPNVPKSLYFYALPTTETLTVSEQTTSAALQQQAIGNMERNDEKTTTKAKFSWRNAGRLLWQHTISAYSNPIVVQWSIWWAFANCGQIQTISYIQFLWKEIAPDNQSVYNGGVEALTTLLGAASAIAAGFLSGQRQRTTHMLVLTFCTVVMGVLLITAAITNSIWVAYANYVIFCVIYFFVITIASTIVAENLVEESFGLIFGINTLVALILQTILTIVAVTDTGYGLLPREQFIVYGAYFLGLAILYFSMVGLLTIWKKLKKPNSGQE